MDRAQAPWDLTVVCLSVNQRQKFGEKASLCDKVIREIKLDVTWSYVKWQTAKMTSEYVFFFSNPSLKYIKIEKCLLLFATNTNTHSTVQRAKDRRQKVHFCHLPFDVRLRNV